MTTHELYIALQRSWIEILGIKEGTKVKVTRVAEDYESGWNERFAGRMHTAVGRTYTLQEGFNCGGTGIEVYIKEEERIFRFPYFVLEVVDEPKVKDVTYVKTILPSNRTFKHANLDMIIDVSSKLVTFTDGLTGVHISFDALEELAKVQIPDTISAFVTRFCFGPITLDVSDLARIKRNLEDFKAKY